VARPTSPFNYKNYTFDRDIPHRPGYFFLLGDFGVGVFSNKKQEGRSIPYTTNRASVPHTLP